MNQSHANNMLCLCEIHTDLAVDFFNKLATSEQGQVLAYLSQPINSTNQTQTLLEAITA